MIPGFRKIRLINLISYSAKFSTFYRVTSGEYPPCIKHAIEILEKGGKSYHIRVDLCLATFLYYPKGQSVEQIAPLFKNAPDYNERE